jgi:transcriptional regulator with GAF, ATPase, and Fis domain
MEDQNKTPDQLRNELMELRRRLAELEVEVNESKYVKEPLQRSEEEAKRLAQENAIMAEIGRIISSTLNIEEVYERFAEEVRKLIPFERIMINLIDLKNNTSTTAYIAGIDMPGRRIGDITPMAGTVTEEVIRTRSSMLIQVYDDKNIEEVVRRFPRLLPTFQVGLRSLMFVPLISKDQVTGVLSLRATKRNAYTERDQKLTERVGNQIAGAIANAEVFKELQKALKQVKQLSGLLPICASCKKIRDDKGYWNQIESYIRDHSEAEFSHGICPECMKKLYPGNDENVKIKFPN